MPYRLFPMKSLRNLLLVSCLLSTSLLSLTSCEEVIDYDLKTADEKFVIEGLVTDQPGPYTVRLTTTKGYLNQGHVPTADAELVTITDVESNVVDTLRRTAPGVYQTTPKLGTGQINHHYRLLVRRDGREQTAESLLTSCSPIDSLSFKYKTPRTDLVADSGYYATLYFYEPAGRGNYYRVNIYQNSTWRNRDEIVTFDDEFYDGNYGDPEIGYDFRPGDTITVEMRSIDKPTYDFYVGLSAAQQIQGTPFDSPPANAPTNIHGGAIGLFAANGIRRASRVAPLR